MFKIVEVPVRCCDIGGWLDTWFAERGEVLNLGVFSRYCGGAGPFRGVEVMVTRETGPGNLVIIQAADPSDDVVISTHNLRIGQFDRRNLLLATLSLLELKEEPGLSLIIRIASPVPPGASLGTSAAVAVGFIKALAREPLNDEQVAKLAWQAETEVMGGQSGVQDQFAAVLAGDAHRVSVTSFREWQITARRVDIAQKTRNRLEGGLLTVYYGAHDSSCSHQAVIRELEAEGPESLKLQPFRGLAKKAEGALADGDLVTFGQVMNENTEAQRKLCSGIVSPRAEMLMVLAGKNQVLGCKVNGAGGSGGTVTCLFRDRTNALEYYQLLRQCGLAAELGLRFFEHRLAGRFRPVQ